MELQNTSNIGKFNHSWISGVLLFIAALTLNLAGNGRIGIWDRDEARFSQAARQMLESRNWVVPYFNTAPRYDKPVLIYWLMDAAIKVFGVNEFSVRLPAAVAGAATVALVFMLALSLGCATGPATLAAVITMTSALPLGVAKAATTDGVLTLTVVAMMALLWRQRKAGFSWGRHLLLYAVLGASVILKGPPGLLVLTTAVAAEWIWRSILERGTFRIDWRAQAFRWAAGLVVFCAVALPWAILAWQRTHGEYFGVAIGKHVVGRSLSAMESHGGKGIFYFLCLPAYIPILFLGIFPWSAPALLGLRQSWLRRNETSFRFLWCWLAPAFLVFSLVATKLPHYITPLIPAVALMTGLWWQEFANARAGTEPATGWWRAGALTMVILAVAAAVGLLGLTIHLKFKPLVAPAILTALLALSGFAWGARFWHRREALAAMKAWGATMAAAILIVFLWALPAVEPLKPSKIMVGWVKEHAPKGTRLLAAEYREPSLVFYWGSTVEMLSNGGHDDALARLRETDKPTAMIATKKRWEKWIGEEPQLAAAGTIRYERKCFSFQRAAWNEMIVVGNWK